MKYNYYKKEGEIMKKNEVNSRDTFSFIIKFFFIAIIIVLSISAI